MSIRLYLDYISQPCRAVLSLCKFGKINVEIVEKRLQKEEQISIDMLKLNPLRMLPCIEDCGNDNIRITESHTIMRYLSRSRGNLNSFYPNDPTLSCKIDEYLDWHLSNTRRFSWLLGACLPDNFFHFKDNNRNTEFKKAKLTLTLIDNYFLKDGKFINNSDRATIADISAVCEFIQLEFIDFSFKEFSNVENWLKRMMEFQEIKESHENFYKVLERFKSKSKIKKKF